jgi:hypothetical protein
VKREEAARRADALNDRISEVSEKLDSLVDIVKQEVVALDEAFLLGLVPAFLRVKEGFDGLDHVIREGFDLFGFGRFRLPRRETEVLDSFN